MSDVVDSFDLTALELVASLAWMAFLAVAGALALAAAGERRVVVIASVGPVVSLLTWICLTNLVGHFAPVGVAALVATMLVAFAAGALGWWRRDGLLASVTLGASRSVAVTLLVASLAFSGISTATTWRMLMYDDREPSHIASALSMIHTGYPPLEPERPTEQFNYHYAPETFSASLLDAVGVPVWRGYDLQIALFSFLAIPVVFSTVLLMAERMASRRPDIYALVAAILATMGTGWSWMVIFEDEASRAAASRLVSSPWVGSRALFDAVLGAFPASRGTTLSAFGRNMHNKSIAIGFPASAAALYLAMRFVEPHRPPASRALVGAMAVLTLATLALAAETYLAVVLVGLAVFVGGEAVRARSWHPLAWSTPIVAATAAIGATQGGVLTARGEATTGDSSFAIADPMFHIAVFGGSLPAWSSSVLLEWLPLVLPALPALGMLIVRRRDPMVLALAVMSVVALAVPLLLVYRVSPPETLRFLPVAGAIAAGCVGVTVVRLLRWRRTWWSGIPSALLLVSLVATTALYQLHAALYPFDYFAGLPQPPKTPGDSQGYPVLGEEQYRDIAALRSLPKGALVAGPPMMPVLFYSGRLPALTGRDGGHMAAMEAVVRSGSLRGASKRSRLRYVYCDTSYAPMCEALDQRVRVEGRELLYERVHPASDDRSRRERAFIVRITDA